MDLVLKKKNSSSDNDPLVVMIDGDKEMGLTQFIQKVNIGETISVSDEVGYKIMAQYKGLFEIAAKEVAYKTKVVKQND